MTDQKQTSEKRTLEIKDVTDWLEELATDLHGEGDTYGAHIIRSSFPDLKEEFFKVSTLGAMDLATALGLNADLMEQTKDLYKEIAELKGQIK